MKKIYTSNYARNCDNSMAIGISIIMPEWYTGKYLAFLAPKVEMVGKYNKGEMNYTQRKYTRDYIDLLKSRNVDPHELIKKIPDGSILLCYESPGMFCHRRILADWIERHTGLVVPEWKNETEKEKEKQNKTIDSILNF